MAANPLARSNPQRSESRYALGNLAPVREEADVELRVRGKIPDGLRGAFYRNGPNPQYIPGATYHPFLGDGMIHGFWLNGGRARYRNRYVRTPRWLAEPGLRRMIVAIHRAQPQHGGEGALYVLLKRRRPAVEL